jgi:hypothetical protein
MAILQNRLHWMGIALVAAILFWNVVGVPHRLRAQEPHQFPFSTGDTVSVGFIPEGGVTCVVAEVRGNFLKCAEVQSRETPTFNRPRFPKVETWYNLATVRYIDRTLTAR